MYCDKGEALMINQSQLDHLYKLKKEIEKSNNKQLINTINQVIKKVYLNQFTISFVGHFSAGKSTLINLLLEQDILPSSPVPTTSNTAIVSVAEEEGIIANITGQQYTRLKTYDEVKQMNRLNVDVESIEIAINSTKFKPGFTLQDTPGVDSNISTHLSSTEQYMYTSNLIVYTVDYNHVQSALNFKFLKRMNEAGLPVVFVINQIDKHQEEELSFDTFKKKVAQSIKEWDINVEQIYYVSKFEHPHNQLKDLSRDLVTMDEHRESINQYVERTLDFIAHSQLSYIQSELQNILETLDIEEQDFQEAYLRFQQNQAVSEEAKMLNNPQELLRFLKMKRKDILENAYIMTHDMREQIRFYLESMSKDFKVHGFLNKKKKKEAEQQRRLKLVIDMLQDKVNQQIRQLMREDMSFLTRFINNSTVTSNILNQHYHIDEALVSSLYQPQTAISNTYVLTFSDDTLKAIRKFVEQESEPLFEQASKYAQANDLSDDADNDLTIYERFIELKQLKESLTTKNYRHYYIHLDDSLDKLIGRTETNYMLSETTDSHEHAHMETVKHKEKTQHADIAEGLNIIKDIPLFKQTKMDIQDTLKRMNQNIVKIAVFGTFSAGKSSLINALLGDTYLVSSPNPTTAATTELSYGEQSYITLKTNDQLVAELNDILKYHHLSFDSLEALLKSDLNQIKQKLPKNQLAFINAIEKHASLYQTMLTQGTKHNIEQAEIKKWSSEDAYAAFVKTVHLKLPIEWLQDKIIVDSLGLHSNNQRHTNETEQILTSADLILYVSYFNHSFTDNDKAFIEHMKAMNQLNDHQSFKMIVNAIDLAESKNDIDSVKEYVFNALNQVGLKSEIYTVSSRIGLKRNDEGIINLRDSIDYFAKVEAKSILETQMIHQLAQIKQAYAELIDDYYNNEAQLRTRNNKLQQYQQETHVATQLITTSSQLSINEIDDQIYYLNDRLKLQLLDDVKSVFNSQLTQHPDFSKQKSDATKDYLTQIHQRFYLEQTLITERIKKHFQQDIERQLSPVLKKLEQVHIFIQPELNINIEISNTPILTIELEDMLKVLPKNLTKRNILNHNIQRKIQQNIAQQTLHLIQNGLNDLRHKLQKVIKDMEDQYEHVFLDLENEVQTQIQTLLSFKLDNQLITSIEHAARQLDHILQGKEGRTYDE